MTVETRHAADDGAVFGEVPVAVELGELREDTAQVVEGVGAPRMAREPCDLPGRELAEDRAGQRLALRAEPVDLLADVDPRIPVDMTELLDLRFQIGDRSFEVEKIHARLRWRGRFEAPRRSVHGGQRYPCAGADTTCVQAAFGVVSFTRPRPVSLRRRVPRAGRGSPHPESALRRRTTVLCRKQRVRCTDTETSLTPPARSDALAAVRATYDRGTTPCRQYSIRTRSAPATSRSRAMRSSAGRTAHASPKASLARASRRR